MKYPKLSSAVLYPVRLSDHKPMKPMKTLTNWQKHWTVQEAQVWSDDHDHNLNITAH